MTPKVSRYSELSEHYMRLVIARRGEINSGGSMSTKSRRLCEDDESKPFRHLVQNERGLQEGIEDHGVRDQAMEQREGRRSLISFLGLRRLRLLEVSWTLKLCVRFPLTVTSHGRSKVFLDWMQSKRSIRNHVCKV